MRLCRFICFFILYLKFSKKLWTVTSVDLKKKPKQKPHQPKTNNTNHSSRVKCVVMPLILYFSFCVQ